MARLSKTDWISAGFRALTLAGPQALNIEKIAVDLGVSKGSFYWHFKSLGMYKSAMIDHWVSMGTNRLIAHVTSEHSDPTDRLKQLIAEIADTEFSKYGGQQAESAIRNWAKFDPEVGRSVHKVDQLRLEFLEQQFNETGQINPKQSARILYAALSGLENMAENTPSKLKQDLGYLLDALLLAANNKAI
ncbi:MAG: TetR/AcrR family transcriptional regulator [Rhodobacteraceae bacterium]|nr:TetR/AcrR family transcriptional regulator [Paracoccaceae bacterium]